MAEDAKPTGDTEEPKDNQETIMPHDGLFVDGMARPQVYLQFFDEKLPSWLKQCIVPGTIKPVDGTLIDRDLRKLLTDAAFEALVQKPDGSEERVYIKILVEHFSHLPSNAVLRVFRYLFEIWATWKKQHPNTKLPFIYPIICYTGKTRAPKVKPFFDLVDAPESWLLKLFQEPVQLINVGQDRPDELGKQRLHLRILFEAYKINLMSPPDPSQLFDLFRELKQGEAPQDWQDYFLVIIRYIIQVTDLDVAQLRQAAESRIDKEVGEVFMSTYDRIFESGKEEGKKEGKKDGKSEALCEIIEERFGGLPEWVSQKLAEATPEALSTWIKLALTKNELKDVFA